MRRVEIPNTQRVKVIDRIEKRLFGKLLDMPQSIKDLDPRKVAVKVLTNDDWREMDDALGSLTVANIFAIDSEKNQASDFLMSAGDIFPSNLDPTLRDLSTARKDVKKIIAKWNLSEYLTVPYNRDGAPCELIASKGYTLQRNDITEERPDGKREVVGMELIVRNFKDINLQY